MQLNESVKEAGEENAKEKEKLNDGEEQEKDTFPSPRTRSRIYDQQGRYAGADAADDACADIHHKDCGMLRGQGRGI